MSVAGQVQKFGSKFIPQSKTIVQASFTGIGFTKLFADAGASHFEVSISWGKKLKDFDRRYSF